ARATGRRVRVALVEMRDGRRNIVGTLERCDSEGIVVMVDGSELRIGYGEIRKASLEVTQQELFGKGKR
ncbi:MAG: ribosome maturation factor RimP, partial [Verrucomicrobiota bacterium]